jgi:ribonuclease E
MPDLEDDPDSQDLAEVFDEENLTRDGFDIAHPDMAPDVYDVTSAIGDADDEEAEIGEDVDFDEIDEYEREAMLEEDDGADSDDDVRVHDADLVTADDQSPADFQGRQEDFESDETDETGTDET